MTSRKTSQIMTFKRFIKSDIYRQMREEYLLKREQELKEQPTVEVEDHVSSN